MTDPVAASTRPGRSGPRNRSSRARLATPGTTRCGVRGGVAAGRGAEGAVRTRLLVLSATFLTVLCLSPAKNGAAQRNTV